MSTIKLKLVNKLSVWEKGAKRRRKTEWTRGSAEKRGIHALLRSLVSSYVR